MLPALPFGPFTDGGTFANAFIFALGFAMIFIVYYIAKRMQIFIGSTKKGFSVYQEMNGTIEYSEQTDNNEQETNQVSRMINDFLEHCDVSNCV